MVELRSLIQHPEYRSGLPGSRSASLQPPPPSGSITHLGAEIFISSIYTDAESTFVLDKQKIISFKKKTKIAQKSGSSPALKKKDREGAKNSGVPYSGNISSLSLSSSVPSPTLQPKKEISSVPVPVQHSVVSDSL